METTTLNRAVYYKGGILSEGTKVVVVQVNESTSMVRIVNDDRYEYVIPNDALTPVKLFTMDEVLNLTYLAMMYGRRSRFNTKQAKTAHGNWARSIFAPDNVPKT